MNKNTKNINNTNGKNNLNHLAIIMDGNGRWAKKRLLPIAAGHKKGAETLKNLLSACAKQGIKYLTVYAFSSENWRRPEEEVSDLMKLLKYYLSKELDTLHKNNIRLHVIGDKSALSDELQKKITDAEELTASNDDFHLSVCLNYGARSEITNAARNIAQMALDGKITQDNIDSKIDEQFISSQLYTADIPDPELLIRTGGEIRLSNYLLWQMAYTELYFCDCLWPDFDAGELQKAIDWFEGRQRRFGGR